MKNLDTLYKVDDSSLPIFKKYNFGILIDKDKTIRCETNFKTSKANIRAFANDMLNEFISVREINEFVNGFKVAIYTFGGINKMYDYAQIQHILHLRNKLKSNFPLFEIGLKRADRYLVQHIVEKIVGDTNEIGKVQIYDNFYTLFEEPKTGLLLTTYTSEIDKWVLNNGAMAIVCSSYIGIIVPSFELCHKIAKALAKAGCDEIEWPYNGYGALSISDLNRKNVSAHTGKVKSNSRGTFILDASKELKAKELLNSQKV